MVRIVRMQENEHIVPASQWGFVIGVVVIVLVIGYITGMYDFEQDEFITS
ncbi:hypothetical protein [Evansella clarkii]|jgi:hypothetical protein|nr:hypothetical protein [Evansella clarkii]